MSNEHESIEFDVLFVGGGPANLAGAIRLMQIAQGNNCDLSIALIEKGSEIGAHQVSSAVMNPRALAELIPDYSEQGCPIQSTVREDAFMFLTHGKAYKIPMVPPKMKNSGNVVISLSRFTAWLAEKAENLGVDLLPGFAGTKVLFGADVQTITGVRTGDMGLDKNGEPKPNFEPGMDILAKVTVFGEGARGSLMKELDAQLGIGQDRKPQIYETGIKEVIQLPEDNFFRSGTANDIHTIGYPLGLKIPGGGFIYEYADDKISIGFLVGLGYEDALVDPYETFIRFKQHPFVAEIIKGGKVIEQGARTVSTGGYYTMPRLAMNGAVVVGGAAGFQTRPPSRGFMFP